MKNLDQIVTVITTAACASIPAADYASVCVTYDADQLDSVGATDPVARKADAVQFELHQGPCVAALAEATLVAASDVGTDARWPAYAARTDELGVHAHLAVPLGTEARSAVLNLYSTSHTAWDGHAVRLASVYAEQIASVMRLVRDVETLTERCQRRQVISQAIGIVMERFGLDEDAAFGYLVAASQSTQTKVRVLARDLVRQGDSGRSQA